MYFILICLGIMNALDGILTYIGLNHTIITEANPLMNNAWEISPIYFLVVKLGLSLFVIFLGKYLHLLKRTKWFERFTYIACGLYVEVLITHLKWLF